MRRNKSTKTIRNKARGLVALTAAIAACSLTPDADADLMSAGARLALTDPSPGERDENGRPTENDSLISTYQRDCDHIRPGKKAGKKAGKKRRRAVAEGSSERYAKMPGGPMRARLRGA